MVDNIGALNQARLALANLSAKRTKTEAETKLDDILRDMKRAGPKAALEAAKRKAEQIKIKLEALKLAAATASATGNANAAKSVARQIKELTRELGNAVRDAGMEIGKASAAAKPVVPNALVQAGFAPNSATDAAQGGDSGLTQAEVTAMRKELSDLKENAAKLAKELKKVLIKAQFALYHPFTDRRDASKAEAEFRDAHAAVGALWAQSVSAIGAGFDGKV